MTNATTQRRHEKLSNIDIDRVDGGCLVFDTSGHGRRLIGFTDVDDWSAVRDELAARGHGVGAVHHKEVYEPAEVGLR